MTQSPSMDAVRKALGTVSDNIYGKPLVELDLLQNIKLDGAHFAATIVQGAPSEANRTQIAAALEQALRPLGVTDIAITWDLRVPTREPSSSDPLPKVRNVVLVMSGKGGVGKSSSAVNLAVALARAGAKVGLLDADIYGPSIPTMLGVNEHPHAIEGQGIQPLERFGVKLMSIGFLLEDPKAAVIWRGPMLHGALQQFLTDVNWGELDYLVLDLPPGTGDVALTLSQKMKVTGAVIVTTPQEVALQDVYKSVSMCKKLSIPVLGVLENMSFFMDSAGIRHELFGQGGGAKIAEYAESSLLGQIPIDPLVREWADRGTPVVQAQPASPIAQAFAQVAEKLAIVIARGHLERSGGDKAPPSEAAPRLKIVR